MTKRFLVLLFCVLSGCQKKEATHSVVWEAGHGPVPTAPPSLNASVMQIKVKGETLERYLQSVDGAEVEGTYLQQILSSDKSPVFLRMKYVDYKKSSQASEISKMRAGADSFLKKAKNRFRELNAAKWIGPIKVVYSARPSRPQLFYQLDVMLSDSGPVERWKVSRALRVLEKTRISSYFDGQGSAYPNGPQWSQIEDVVLPNLIGDGQLANARLKIHSETGVPALSPQQAFFFKPEDPRFDQVQVFYYANKMVQLFKSRLGVELPFALEFKTHMGFPEKKTVMFYYNHQIRLGQGDDIHYKEILKDPTIVMHETAHAYVEALSGLEQGALNEAFADFFTTSFLNHPNLGEFSYVKGPYTRTVENELSFKDMKGTVYGDSLIVSGTLWEIRKAIGAARTENLAVKSLMRIGPEGTVANIGPVLKAVAELELADGDKAKVLRILEQRQLPLEEAP